MEYAVLLYGDEKRWDNADDAERTRVYGQHTEFMRLLEEHGHKITGGAELRNTPSARTVRGTADSVSVTDGPYAETAEQLGGFYLVETEDVDDLAKLVGIISEGEPCEIRPCVPNSEQS